MTTGETSRAEFQALYKQHYRSVFYFFSNRGLPVEDSKDLTQDTFLRVYEHMSSFRHEAEFRTWLLKICANIWCNYLRTKSTKKRQANLVPLEKISEPADPPSDSSPNRETGPLGKMINKEQEQIMHLAIKTLPSRMRRCVELRMYQDLKYREIAQIMELSIQTVKSQLSQARGRLKDFIAKKAKAPTLEGEIG